MKSRNLYASLVNLNAIYITLSVSVFDKYINVKLASLIFMLINFILYCIFPFESEYGNSVSTVLSKSKTAKILLAIIFVLIIFILAHSFFKFLK